MGDDTELSWEDAPAIMEHYREVDSEREELAAAHLSEDQQEALSIRFAQGLWVVPLSSGAWAIFGVDRKLITITRLLDPEALRNMDFLQGQQWSEEQVGRMASHGARSGRVSHTDASAEELDL